MSTAQEFIEDALSEVLVNPSEAPLEADEVQSAIRMMNDMVNSWDYPIGWTDIENPSDEVTITKVGNLAVKKNLAVELAPQFDGFVSQNLMKAARGALASLRRKVIEVGEMSYPSRLPVGTGNQDRTSTTFYPASDAELVQEDGGSIILEDQ
jgi:hypothetical protein